MIEKEIAKNDVQLHNMRVQVQSLEQSTVDMSTIQAMQVGASALQKMNENADVDAVMKTMDDVQEQLDIAHEVSETIAQPIGSIFDENELLEELKELEKDVSSQPLLNEDIANTQLTSQEVEGQTHTPSSASKKRSREEGLMASSRKKIREEKEIENQLATVMVPMESPKQSKIAQDLEEEELAILEAALA